MGTHVVMDKTGPHPPAFLGERYDNVCADVESGVIVMGHYKHKSENTNDLPRLILEFDSRSGRHVLVLTMDNAGEHKSRATMNMLINVLKIRPSFTPSYDHNGGHIVEGIHSWMKKATLAAMKHGNAGPAWRAHTKAAVAFVHNHTPRDVELLSISTIPTITPMNKLEGNKHIFPKEAFQAPVLPVHQDIRKRHAAQERRPTVRKGDFCRL